MTHLDQLLAVSTAFCQARKVSASRASTLVFGDGKILGRLAEGSDLTTRRLEGAFQWFSDNWPPTAVWPHDVGRPDPKIVPAAPVRDNRSAA